MIKQEWVDKQVTEYSLEKRKSKDYPMSEYIRILLLLVCVFFCSTSLDADIEESFRTFDGDVIILEREHIYDSDNGIWFMCKSCRLCQWQAQNQCDWRGYYYCVGCGSRYE